MTLPLWLHSLLRIFLPLPSAMAVAVLSGWGCVVFLRGRTVQESPGWVLGCLGGSLVLTILGWLSPRWTLRPVGVPCQCCGQRARYAPCKGDPDYACTSCGRHFDSPLQAVQVVPGVLCIGAGLFALVAIIPGARETWVLAVFSVGMAALFFGAGALFLGGQPLQRRVVARWPWISDLRGALAPWIGGGVALVAGVGILCAGIWGDVSTMPVGRGGPIIAGIAFTLAGVSILLAQMRSSCGGRAHRFLGRTITGVGVLLLLTMTAAPLLIAGVEWGRGEVEGGAILSGVMMLLLLGVVTYVWFRDRGKRERSRS